MGLGLVVHRAESRAGISHYLTMIFVQPARKSGHYDTFVSALMNVFAWEISIHSSVRDKITTSVDIRSHSAPFAMLRLSVSSLCSLITLYAIGIVIGSNSSSSSLIHYLHQKGNLGRNSVPSSIPERVTGSYCVREQDRAPTSTARRARLRNALVGRALTKDNVLTQDLFTPLSAESHLVGWRLVRCVGSCE